MKTNTPIRSFDFNKLHPIEIEILDLDVLKKKPEAFEGHNQAQFLQLLWVSKGELRIDVDFMPIHIYEGEIFLISINQVYRFDANSACEGKLIIFTNDFFSLTELDNHLLHWSQLFNPLYLNPKVQLSTDFLSPFLALMEQELSLKKDFFQTHIAQSFLRILLLKIEHSLNSKNIEKIEHLDLRIGRRFCDMIGKEFTEHHHISYFQQQLGVSEKVLTKEVKEFTGQTPKEYLDARIILEAKRLLSYGKNLSVKEVGIQLGFDEPTNFNKFFKKHTNLTPVQFKANSSS